nr:hypothetical protein BaRGS_033152 [Batillaria attramentaria]
MNYFALPEHGGTHIDAPAHYVQGKWRTHQIPASNLIGPGVIVDVTEKVKDNEDYAVTVDDLQVLLAKNIMLLEYVANVESLPPSGSTIVIGVVNLRDGSGGPARIMGMLGQGAGATGSSVA